MDPRYDFSAPETKRGAWFVLLLNAYIARTEASIRNCCYQLRYLQSHFPCLKCKDHFGKYLLENPPEAVVGSTRTIFEWTVDFMSAVNTRIGKQPYNTPMLLEEFKSGNFTSPNPLYDFTNPWKLRDIWLVLLCNSLAIRSTDEAKLFVIQVRMLAAKHPLLKYKTYFYEYLARDPIDLHITEHLGCFVWVSNLMSYVAVSEGKDPYDRYLFYQQFSTAAVAQPCASCGH